MSLLSDVSIAVTPNGYKAEKLYAVIPSSGAADMVVTRATNATRVNEDGLIESVLSNVPRIDYTGGGCPHILVEPQRTNLITYSEAFDNAYWAKSGLSVVSGQISPSGNTSAFKWVEDTSTGNHTITGGPLVVSSGSVTMSLIIKANGRNWVKIAEPNLTGFYVYFDITNDVIGTTNSATGKIIDLGNGYKRISMSFVATGNCSFQIRSAYADGSTSYTGDGVSGFYLWGGQLEQGSYPTSYIPTSGSTVTRNQDQFTRNNLASLINSTEGVLFVESAALANDGTNRILTLSDNSYTNSLRIQYYTNTNEIEMRAVVGGAAQALQRVTITNVLEFNKIAFLYKVNDFQLWVNGSKLRFDTSGTVPPTGTYNTLSFDDGDGNNIFFSKVKQLQVFKTTLSDSQLAALTS